MWQLSVTRDCFQVFISFIVRFLTSQHVVWTRWIDSSWHTEQIQGTEICLRFVNKLRHNARNQQLWFAKESRPQSDSTLIHHHCFGAILNLYHNHFPLPLHLLYAPHRSSSTDWCTGSLNTNACCVHLTYACMWSRWLQQLRRTE